MKSKIGIRKIFKKVFSSDRKFLVLIIISIIFSLVSSILLIIGPDKLSDITNIISSGLVTGINMDKVKHLTTILVIMFSCSLVLGYFQGYIMAYVNLKFSKNLRSEIVKKINVLPLKYFDKTTYGDILSRLTNDVDTLASALESSVVVIVSSATLLIGSVIMMFYTSYIMAISAILSSLIGFILMIFILSKSNKYFIMQQKQLGIINGHIEESYTGHNIIKSYNGEECSMKRFEEINDKMFNSSKKSQFLSGLMMPINGFISNFGYVCVCVVGSLLVMKGSITFGVIVAFMLYVRHFNQPLSQISQVATRMQPAYAAGLRIFEFLEEEEMRVENNNIINMKSIKGNIEFKNVSFSYSKDKKVIDNFSVMVKSGQKVAIVGKTGAGKTTIVNLLMKFYDISSGDILIDGVSINRITRDNIHDLFCMVLQDTWIFEGSVRENIVYNKKNISNKDVESVCKTIGLDHYIKTLPNGYDTYISSDYGLSSGEKQLITIARGMIKNSPLLILDEATSNVDTRTEAIIQEAMDKLTKGRTSFIIAHRLSTIKNADIILVLDNGNIVEKGSHEELMKASGTYYSLYNSQFQN
ncbi:MAG: ABC transporter ATP-binding protein [Bacilli bacterium]